jgi:MFS family permease
MLLTANSFVTVFWIAVIPAFLSFFVILFLVHEPERPPGLREVKSPLSRAELSRLGPAYWRVVTIASIFTLARFSEAFLILRAQSVGLAVALAPAVMVVMNVVYALTAFPAGAQSDRMDARFFLIAGLAVLISADLFLALSTGVAGVMIGVMLWGLHMGLTQGLLSALVANAAPAELRGTAFGVFHLVTGVALLLASVIAGMLWQKIGPEGTFLAGAMFAAVALVGLLAQPSHK